MEEAQVRFGVLTSADVKIWLTGPNKEKYERNPVFLHSVILKRSELFRVKMSERWKSDKPGELRVTTCHNFDDYVKCIELMYGERVYFSNVEQCLAILSVASELLADDCINKCMQYLEAVRWSSEQESQIRDVLSSLGLKLLPDLADRLDKKNGEDINFMERIISEMVSLIIDQKASGRNRRTAEKYIAGILEEDSSREVAEVCGRVLLQEFKSSIQFRNIFPMKLLFKHIKHCDGDILEAAFIAFCEDPEFTKYVRVIEFDRNAVFYIIIRFMYAIGDGKIVISRASRISFLTTWLPIMGELCSKRLPIMGELCCKRSRMRGELDKAVRNVVESLPLVDRRRICLEWTGVYRKFNIDIATPFTLFKGLQDKSTSKD